MSRRRHGDREEPDPHEVLGVAPSADAATIRRAYQRLARRHHPEVRPDDPAAAERFARIHRAYRQLAEEPPPPRLRRATRLHYRRTVVRLRREAPKPPAAPARARGGSEGDADLEQELHLDFVEAVRGATVSISVQREQPCPACTDVVAVGCAECGGRGERVELYRVRVRVPPGVADGERLRLAGKGHRRPGGAPGDLYLSVRVAEHPYFRRDGRDVRCDVPVTFREAALGAEVEVPTIDGPVRVRLPAGTSGGRVFRLRGRGIVGADGVRGDQLYRVQVVVPARLDRTSRSLIEQLPDEDVRRGLPDAPLSAPGREE